MSSDPSCKLVDLSYKELSFLPLFVSDNRRAIEHLILDGNNLTETALNVAHFVNLQTLSLNSNQIRDIECLLNRISTRCPNLRHLSLIGNPGWPHPVTSDDAELYEKHRTRAAQLLPNLRFLDSTPVRHTVKDRVEIGPSSETCAFVKVRYIYKGTSSEGNRFIRDNQL